MIGTLVYQLTRNLSCEDLKKGGFDAYFVDHTTGIYPSSAAGVPFTAAYLQSKGDVITDLHENMAAEQIIKGSGKGKEKKQYVMDFLLSKGITFDTDEIEALIESEVYKLTQGSGYFLTTPEDNFTTDEADTDDMP